MCSLHNKTHLDNHNHSTIKISGNYKSTYNIHFLSVRCQKNFQKPKSDPPYAPQTSSEKGSVSVYEQSQPRFGFQQKKKNQSRSEFCKTMQKL